MESITLGQIATAVALLAGLVTGIGLLNKRLKEYIGSTLTEKFNSVEMRLDILANRVEDVDMNNCKNFLVQVLSDVEAGVHVDQVELQRFWEEYDFYTNHGGNSYIRERTNQLKERGLL